MSEKRESDEFEEDDADESVESDDPDLEHLIRDLDQQKRRNGPKGGEPAWRRLEKYMEQKRTAELLSDFDDYEIDDEPGAGDDGYDAAAELGDDEDEDDESARAGRTRKRAR